SHPYPTLLIRAGHNLKNRPSSRCWHKETDMATRLESAIAEGKVRTYEKHVRSPPRHGLAVARAATLPHSPSPRPSPITPVHKSSEARSRLFFGPVDADFPVGNQNKTSFPGCHVFRLENIQHSAVQSDPTREAQPEKKQPG